MESREELAAKSQQASRGILDILGHLHHLSQHVAAGEIERVLELAVDIPLRCLRVDKCALLLPSPASRIPAIVASRNLSPTLREHLTDPTRDEIILFAASKSEPKVVEDLTTLPTEVARPYLREDVRSIAAIPVQPTGSPAGVLLCLMCRRTSFTVWEIELLYTVANHVAAAIGRTSPKPGDLARSFTSDRLNWFRLPHLDVRQLLERALAEVIYAVNADSGSAMLYEGGSLTICAVQNLAETITPGTKVEAGSGIAEWVVAHQEPLILDGPADPRKFGPIPERPELVSSICVPLKGKQKLVGVLSVNSTRPNRKFGIGEFVLVSTVAGHVGLAVENTIIYQAARTQTRFLNSLFRIGKTITSSLDLSNVLAMIMEQVQALAGTDICCIILQDLLTGHMQLAGGRGLEGTRHEEYIDLAAPGIRIARERRRYVVIPDVREFEDLKHTEILDKYGVCSEAIIPLAIKRKHVGYLVLFRKEPGGLPQQVLRLLVGFAELAAIAIENARLYARQADIAHITQHQLTPRALGPIPGFDIGYKYVPADLVGGDYFDVVKITESEYGIVIADVSGRSTTAASHMVMCKHSLRALSDELLSPAQIIQKMNRLIHDETGPEAFISMFYGVMNTKKRVFSFCCAGHEPGLLYRADTGRIEYLNTKGLLLGVAPSAYFEECKTHLKSDDVLLLYTDGLVDAISRQYGVAIGEITCTLSENCLKSAQEMADNIYKLVRTHTTESVDDVAFLVLKAI